MSISLRRVPKRRPCYGLMTLSLNQIPLSAIVIIEAARMIKLRCSMRMWKLFDFPPFWKEHSVFPPRGLKFYSNTFRRHLSAAGDLIRSGVCDNQQWGDVFQMFRTDRSLSIQSVSLNTCSRLKNFQLPIRWAHSLFKSWDCMVPCIPVLYRRKLESSKLKVPDAA